MSERAGSLMTWPERLVARFARGSSRRGFLGGAALVGAALAADPVGFLIRPISAYASICGTGASCADGYTVFCCTINSGRNSCPPDSFIGGWWKADNSSFCGGAARYYIDCNAFRDGHYTCHCNQSTCDQRRVACNQFRYGQCNLQIPYANTGPVLCRVVSCTPPWQQYAGVCSSSSATDNNTATHSAPCVDTVPIGHVDSISSVGNTVHISGWAFDPDQPATSIDVAVYQEDGHGFGWFPTSIRRADVNATYRLTGNHGFSIALAATSGRHTFRVFGINVGGGSGNPQLASLPLTVNPGVNPVGRVDAVGVAGNTVRWRGWAADGDRPAASITVALVQDGVEIARFGTPGLRPDVNAAFRLTGNHGFDFTVTATNGPHEFVLRAVNVGGGVGDPAISNTVLWNAVVNVNPGSIPFGHLDSVVADGTTVRLRGWAYDPDQPATSVQIAVLEDGQELSSYPSTVVRPDVDAAYRISGAHGFDISLSTTSAVHAYAVSAINVGGGAGDRRLGTRVVAVNVTAPLGTLDSVVVLGPTLRAVGWAFDPDQPASAIGVELFVDGASVAVFPTGVQRADVNRVYRLTGAHGFDFTTPIAPGRHTITLYALDIGGIRPNPLIGTRTVTA